MRGQFSIKLLLAMFVLASFGLAVNAQQRTDGSSDLSKNYDQVKESMLRKQQAEQNAVLYTYDAAKKLMLNKVRAGEPVSLASLPGQGTVAPELARKAKMEYFAQNKETIFNTNPAEYEALKAELYPATATTVTEMAQSEYNSVSAQKKAYIDANPQQFKIVANPSTK
jgi:hypothetical protein